VTFSYCSQAVNQAVKKSWSMAEAKTTVEAIDNAMRKLGMSKKDACAFMDTTPEQYDVYKQLSSDAKRKPAKSVSR